MTVIKSITSSQNPQTASRSCVKVANNSLFTKWGKKAHTKTDMYASTQVYVYNYREAGTTHIHNVPTLNTHLRSCWANMDFVLLLSASCWQQDSSNMQFLFIVSCLSSTTLASQPDTFAFESLSLQSSLVPRKSWHGSLKHILYV